MKKNPNWGLKCWGFGLDLGHSVAQDSVVVLDSVGMDLTKNIGLITALNLYCKFHGFKSLPGCDICTHLQCTTTGPASAGLQAFTLCTNCNTEDECSGTPWSGQAVNWNWRTSLFSCERFCTVKRVTRLRNESYWFYNIGVRLFT